MLTSALEGLQQRWEESIPSHDEVRAEIEALALLAYQAQDATGDGGETSATSKPGEALPPVSRSQPTGPGPRINQDLLDEARKDAMLLLFALDGYGRDGTYTHEEDDVQMGSLRGLASRLSGKLARIGRQAAGEPEP